MLSSFKNYIQLSPKNNEDNINPTTASNALGNLSGILLGAFFLYMAMRNRDLQEALKDSSINKIINRNPIENNIIALLKQWLYLSKSKGYEFVDSVHNYISSHNIRLIKTKSKSGIHEKLWFEKSRSFTYTLGAAAKEVFFGQLATALLGKNSAPKTKFNLHKLAIISRVIGDDLTKISSLNKGMHYKVKLDSNSEDALLNILCFSMIIGDEDLSNENVIIKYTQTPDWDKIAKDTDHLPQVEMVYGIDHEHAAKSYWLSAQRLNLEWLTNLFNHSEYIRSTVFGSLDSQLLNNLTNAKLQGIFAQLADQISANEYSICSKIREDIYQDLTKPESIYSYVAVNCIIMPSIDAAIKTLKGNISLVKSALLKTRNKPSFMA